MKEFMEVLRESRRPMIELLIVIRVNTLILFNGFFDGKFDKKLDRKLKNFLKNIDNYSVEELERIYENLEDKEKRNN